MTHIEYIRASVDEIKGTVKAGAITTEDHEIRLVKLEAQPSKRSIWPTSGGFLGGLLAGFFSARGGG